MQVQKLPRFAKPVGILLLALFLGIGAGLLHRHVFSNNARFETFTDSLFRQEISSNTLNLHYTLAHPEKYGIRQETITLGQAAPDDPSVLRKSQEEYINTLEKFPYNSLNRENRIIYDILLLYFKTELSLGDHYLLEEILSPSLGIQAQLPILLAEYTFYDEQDIQDYLQLLSCVEPYFDSILEFEERKAEAGYFMSDDTVNRILEQCSAFVKNGEENYLAELFEEKLESFSGISAEKRSEYSAAHTAILTEQVLPAYQDLMTGLTALMGSGQNPYGLCYFENGREYYQYLLRSQAGIYTSVEDVKNRLLRQLLEDSSQMTALAGKNPQLLEQYKDDLESFSPTDALTVLEEKYKEDFPPLEEISYDVKYVPDSLEEFSSPAFYLIPPVDTNSPNTIYINQASQTSNLELFTTLAHEGFPGHLYQTNYFSRCNPQNIRHLLSFGGYVEGWATYIESYAYAYSGLQPDLARLCWLNRSLNLCIYSLLDVGIHYYGWTPGQAGAFLSGFGIQDGDITEEIYQYILETPGNYLKYYLGYLSFLDLKEEMEKKEASDFTLTAFHKKILEIGPAQFPVVKKYLLEDAA